MRYNQDRLAWRVGLGILLGAILLLDGLVTGQARKDGPGNPQSRSNAPSGDPSQEGFISIDCGYNGNSYVTDRNLTWVPDVYYPTPSTAAVIYNTPVQLPSTAMETTLRVFDQGSKNCYQVPVEKEGRYLVRLTFWYSNYDNKNHPPTFNVSIGLTNSGTVALSMYDLQVPEFVVNSTVYPISPSASPTISICFLRIDGDPIVNGLEVRPLPYFSYNSASNGTDVMLLWWRLACGGDPNISTYRYPEDPLDRVWYADEATQQASAGYSIAPLTAPSLHAANTSIISSSFSSPRLLTPNRVPAFIFNEGRSGTGDAGSLLYTFNSLDYPATYHLYLYFRDFLPLSSPPILFDILLDGQLRLPSFDLSSFRNSTDDGALFLFLDFNTTVATSPVLELRPSSSSSTSSPSSFSSSSVEVSSSRSLAALAHLGPLISAIEMFEVFSHAYETPEEQVSALHSLSSSFGSPSSLSAWEGDPCQPVNWPGVQCEYRRRRPVVVGLFLGDFNLSGSIAPDVGNISTLQSIWLNSNFLTGAIPSSMGTLLSLRSLLLQDNHLSGQVPDSLGTLPRLTQINISNNELVGPLPFNTSEQYLQISAQGNPDLCSPSGLYGLPLCSATPPSPATQSSPPPSPSSPSSPSSSSSSGVIIGVAVASSLIALLALGALLLLLRRRRLKQQEQEEKPGKEEVVNGEEELKGEDGADGGGGKATALTVAALVADVPMEAVATKVTPLQQPLLPASSSIVMFSLKELEDATQCFSPANQVGSGGFGPVFRGLLPDGRFIAVKKLAGNSLQGEKEFTNELDLLSRAHHPALVALVGYCTEGGNQILVYDYMANGSVRDHLYDSVGTPLGRLRWLQRLSIALGAAKGIQYLHNVLRPSIIHRDIKTSNILLNHEMAAKVADFGLSRLGPGEDASHVSTNVKGTVGYLDPEYYTVQQLTDKSDVFSFGVVLLELISGRQPINCDRPRAEWNIVDWARMHLQHGDVHAIVDPTLYPGEYLLDAMWKVAEVGILCVEPLGMNRPSISDVVLELAEAIEMEMSSGSRTGEREEDSQGQDVATAMGTGGSSSNVDSNVTFSESGSDPDYVAANGKVAAT